MNVLFHSQTGDSLALALRLQDEGHTVGFYIAVDRCRPIGRGLVFRVEDFIHATEDADLIIFDHVKFGSLADLLREQGHNVVGASKFQDMLELDRAFGMHTFKACGLAIPPTHEFPDASFERAMALVESTGLRYVFKASGNIATDKTYVATDAESMLAYLEHLEKTIEGDEGKRPKFLLQEFVEGVEVSCERWYANGRPMEALNNVTFEAKKFLAGDLGPAVGCAGNVVIPTTDQKLLQMSTARLDRLAAEHHVTGPIDLNQIIAKHDHRAYILEATARFGYDAFQAFVDLWPRPLGPIFLAMARGEIPPIRLGAPMGAAVRVSVPPYPCGDPKQAQATPIVDDVLDDPRIWIGDVNLDPEDEPVCAGVDGVVYVVTGQGPTSDAAFKSCYDWLEKSKLPDKQYRNDLAASMGKRIAELRSWGFLRSSGRLAA